MLTPTAFHKLLQTRGTLIIDGALATELETRGHNLNHPLWSGKTLRDDPSSIQKVHLDYYLAGADIAITASYQATPAGLSAHFNMDESASKELISTSVKLASQAREEAYRQGVRRLLLVAGSVGPYGAYLADGSEYRGDYTLSPEAFKGFHRPRIQALIDAGVDLLALETIPSVTEIRALMELLREEFPSAIAWLSCTIRSPETLSDGTAWEDVLPLLTEQIVGFGVNCVPMSMAAEALKQIGSKTKSPLVCYPNSGETWNAETKTWQSLKADDAQMPGLPEELDRWQQHGAKLIGGCCRTGPDFITAVASHLNPQSSK